MLYFITKYAYVTKNDADDLTVTLLSMRANNKLALLLTHAKDTIMHALSLKASHIIGKSVGFQIISSYSAAVTPHYELCSKVKLGLC